MLNSCAVCGKDIDCRLIFGKKWYIVVEMAENGFNIADHGEKKLVIEVILFDDYPAE